MTLLDQIVLFADPVKMRQLLREMITFFTQLLHSDSQWIVSL